MNTSINDSTTSDFLSFHFAYNEKLVNFSSASCSILNFKFRIPLSESDMSISDGCQWKCVLLSGGRKLLVSFTTIAFLKEEKKYFRITEEFLSGPSLNGFEKGSLKKLLF